MSSHEDTDSQGGTESRAPERVVVFIDAQNMYMGAREAFGWTKSPGRFGNFRPLGLARAVTDAGDRTLVGVRVYTGIPTPQNDPRGNAATQRRMAAWVAEDPALVQIFPRPLRYPPPRGREKGVDVELAIDIVELALDDVFDVLVLASADTDLIPPLQAVMRRCPEKSIETVAWEPLPGHEVDTAAPLDVPGGGVARRTINKTTFDRFADKRDFLRARTDPAKVIGKSRWDKIKARFG